MLTFFLSLCLGLEDLSNIKDIVFWSRQQDLPILGLFKEPVDSRKKSLFKSVAKNFESGESGLSFGLTTTDKAWKRYDLPEDESSAIVIHANYYEDDGEWRARGSTKIIYDSEWDLAKIVVWVTAYSFPPAIDIRHLTKGGADAQRRARFLLGVDMPKVTWMHDGLTAPDFFVSIGKILRGQMLFLVYDVSENENLRDLVDSGGWWLTAGINPLDQSSMWGEYEEELNEEDVTEWVNEVVLSGWLKTYAIQTQEWQAQEKKKKRRRKRRKIKKKKKSKKEL